MRQLTDNERAAMDVARNELLEGIDLDSIKPIIAISAAHRSGFITGLDYRQAEVAALAAENTRLRAEVERLQKECDVMQAILDEISTSPEWEFKGTET